MIRPMVLAGLAVGTTLAVALAATPAQQVVLAKYAALARATDPAFEKFSAERGKIFFDARHAGGKPETPDCAACHTSDLAGPGQQKRTGKTIDPMAASVAPSRYTDFGNVEKWFRRNCSDVLGRECTLAEKGDVLAYLLSL
jgi:cytochrome c peroxidase